LRRINYPNTNNRFNSATLAHCRPAKDKAFFLCGYAKNQRDKIDDTELQALKKMAADLLAYDRKAFGKALKSQETDRGSI
jgi:hypothetical protein